MRLDHDHHVHSTWSDGQHTPEQMLFVAEERGLTTIGFADHVRRDTTWLPAYCAHIEALRRDTLVEVIIGVEAKILDMHGAIDVPDTLHGVERIVLADHQVPGAAGCVHPRVVRAALRAGQCTAKQVVADLVRATANAVLHAPRPVVVGHLFSVLPKIGVEEPEDLAVLDRLWDACLKRGAAIEIDERWRCPSHRVARAAQAAGVEVLASTDSHKARTVGTYKHVARVAAQLGDVIPIRPLLTRNMPANAVA